MIGTAALCNTSCVEWSQLLFAASCSQMLISIWLICVVGQCQGPKRVPSRTSDPRQALHVFMHKITPFTFITTISHLTARSTPLGLANAVDPSGSQVDNLLRYLRQKRSKQLREVDEVFGDVKHDRWPHGRVRVRGCGVAVSQFVGLLPKCSSELSLHAHHLLHLAGSSTNIITMTM